MRASIVLLLLCGCASGSSSSRTAGPTPGSAAAASISGAGGPAATAVIEPRSGSTLTGSASFTAVDGGNLGAHVEVQNATPGQHGVHIHEKGDCSDPKAASAGGHYNPNSGAHHGGPSTPVRHGGDLGNITVGPDGKGTLDVVVGDLSLEQRRQRHRRPLHRRPREDRRPAQRPRRQLRRTVRLRSHPGATGALTHGEQDASVSPQVTSLSAVPAKPASSAPMV